MLKSDKWGNTFWFVDIDYNGGKNRYPSMAYMEIARCLKFWDAPFSFQIEYNGGLNYGQYCFSEDQGFFERAYVPINHAFLAGIDFEWHNENFTRLLNLKILYKNIHKKIRFRFNLRQCGICRFLKAN